MDDREKAKSDDNGQDEVTTTPEAAMAATTTMSGTTANEKASEEAPRELTTKEAYFASLNEWVKRANISQNAMAMFPWYLMHSYPQLFASHAAQASPHIPLMPGMTVPMPTEANGRSGVSAAAGRQPTPLIANNANAALAGIPGLNGFGLRFMNDQTQAEVINRTGGYECVVAPFWKRAVAEAVDMVIMLFLKIITIFVITNVFGYDILTDMEREVLTHDMENEDLTDVLISSIDFLAFSSDLLAFEIATKLFVCLYEAVMTTFFNGASLGKHVMGLSIKYCEAMVILPPNAGGVAPPPPPPAMGAHLQFGFQAARVQVRALLYPAETPNFRRSFLRAVAKNMILSLLFPMFFLMVFFKNNRTAYDILTKTIVVETSSQTTVLRRPQQQQQQ